MREGHVYRKRKGMLDLNSCKRLRNKSVKKSADQAGQFKIGCAGGLE